MSERKEGEIEREGEEGAYLVDVLLTQQLPVFHPAAILEERALDPRERECPLFALAASGSPSLSPSLHLACRGTHLVILSPLQILLIHIQLARGVLPRAPSPRRLQARKLVVRRQTLVVRRDQVSPLCLGDVVAVRRELLREEMRGAVLIAGRGNVSGEEEKRGRRMKNIQEEQFGSTKREDATQDERKDSFGVCLSVCERPTTASSSVASVSVHAIRDALAEERSGAARREREREGENDAQTHRVEPQLPPNTSHLSTPKCERSFSMSATRSHVVLWRSSAVLQSCNHRCEQKQGGRWAESRGKVS